MSRMTKIHKFIVTIFVVTTFFNSYFYFCWDIYPNRFITQIFSICQTVGVLLILYYSIQRERHTINEKAFAFLFVSLLFLLHTGVFTEAGLQIALGHIKIVLLVVSLVLIDDYTKKEIIDKTIKVFIILIIPGTIYYILSLIGIRVPYLHTLLRSDVSARMGGQYYKVYPFGVILYAGGIDRLCGLFDEPGYVGTMCGLFLPYADLKMDKKWFRMLFTIGLISFSTAFYILFFIYLVVKNIITNKKAKAIIGICGIIVLLVAYFIIQNTAFSNPILVFFAEKMNVTGLFSRRINLEFNAILEDFIRNSGAALWFGKGGSAAISLHTGAYSYIMLLYDYGIIGVLLLILYLMTAVRYTGITKTNLPFFVIFVGSIYQRPYVFSLQMITILVCMMCALSKSNDDLLCS